MRSFVVSIVIQVVGSIAILIGGIFGFNALMSLKPEPGETPSDSATQVVSLVNVQAHQDGVQIQVDGVVVPYREISVAAEVAGRVVQKDDKYRAGLFVKKGTVLAQIDKRDYSIDVDRIKKELEQAKASLTELDVNIKGKKKLIALAVKEVELADKEWKRQKNLGTDVVAQSKVDQLERAKLTAEVAHARVVNELSALESSRTRLEKARDLSDRRLKRAELDLERTEIKAPIDGIIVKDDVERDAYVARGKVVYILEDTSRVEVRCNLQMDDLYWIWQAHPGTKKRDARGDYQLPVVQEVEVAYKFAGRNNKRYIWRGRLDRFDGIGLDEQTRTAPCRVVVSNPRQVEIQKRTGAVAENTKAKQPPAKVGEGPPALVRGMFVGVHIKVRPQNVSILRVPETALRPGKVVWKVDGQNTLSIHPVRFVQVWQPKATSADSKLSEILIVSEDGQVAAGDRLVTSPLPFVNSGMKVEVSQ